MKLREKNPLLRETIEKLHKAGVEKPLWKAVAKGMNRPRSRRLEVNLKRLNKLASDKEIVVVPGVVLGDGNIEKRLTVAALKFSSDARKKIERAGGKCLSIEELFESNPDTSKVRIVG
ncbi:MAG: 50S ribosomal protein L18e [Candidatus Aenigmatarchaeota archaeon]